MTDKNMWEGGQEIKANWFKFDKVGDGVKGTLLSRRFQEANQPGYQNQWVYELKQADGNVMNVGIAESKSGTIQRLNSQPIGTIVGILFEKEGEKKPGRFPAKFLKVLSFGQDPNYSEMDGGEEIPFID